jgi:hypothetical protein
MDRFVILSKVFCLDIDEPQATGGGNAKRRPTILTGAERCAVTLRPRVRVIRRKTQ